MSILLDTNACIAAINGQPAVVRERLAHAAARGVAVAVSAVAVFELRYGIAKSAQVASNTERADLFLASLLVLAFDENDARAAGDIRASLERRGTPIGGYDLLIAGQALRRDLLLITANVAEFSRVEGLRWEDWTRPM